MAAMTMKKFEDWVALGRDLLMCVAAGYLVFLVALVSGIIYVGDSRSSLLSLWHLVGLGSLVAFAFLPSLRSRTAPLIRWRNGGTSSWA